MRLKLILILSFVVFVATSVGMAQTKTTVFSSNHDIGAAGCASCHVPHATNDAAGQRGQTLLWTRAFSNQVFGTYSSPSMDSSPAEIGDATFGDSNPPTGDIQASVLCMSCHDGVTTTSLIGPTDAGAVGNPTNSFGLTNDHPINMPWPTTDAGIHTATDAETAGVVLYGATDTVQCGSCHNPHDPTLGSFLRIANTNDASGICAACHL